MSGPRKNFYFINEHAPQRYAAAAKASTADDRIEIAGPQPWSIIRSVTALEQIQQMPLREKLRVMEAIWDDISRAEEILEVPQWHKDILDQRERLIAEGKAQFVDWETAKKQIKEMTK